MEPANAAASAVGTYQIEQVDVRTLPEDELRRVAELSNVFRRESVPEDPPVLIDVLMRRLRVRPKVVIRSEFVAKAADGALVGFAGINRYDKEDNKNLREVDLTVHPEHRRRGIGRALFARLVAATGDAPDIILEGWTNDRIPAGEAFAKRLGARPGLLNREGQLDLATLDRGLVAEWARIDPPGYRLEWVYTAFTPEALVPNVIVAYETAMNTAPRDELQMEDWKMTPELLRAFEQTGEAAGHLRRLVLAIHEATGEAAGFTEVAYDPQYPRLVRQQGTAVVPAHRGHGIGKWIKARMLERILAEWQAARIVRARNAYSNAPMLSINDRLGFKIAWSLMLWQLPIADARRYVEGDVTL